MKYNTELNENYNLINVDLTINYKLTRKYVVYSLCIISVVISETLLFYNTEVLNNISVILATLLLPILSYILSYNKPTQTDLILITVAIINLILVVLRTFNNQGKLFIEQCILDNDPIINCTTITKECYTLYKTLKNNNFKFNTTKFNCNT